jgi:mRNA interferase RelE/StbE
MYDIDWKKKARKQLDRIGDSDTRMQIKTAVATLANWPSVINVKPLVSHQYSFRLEWDGTGFFLK